ncbi:hypothetical protein ACF0H5_010087 [Mactra antiquata]
MEDLTCMEYLLQCANNNNQCLITQDILLNASNEFRNIWNLVKKLQSVARIDVRKITKFLDSVQDSLTDKKWDTTSTLGVYADLEYEQIKKYIRASYLEEYKVVKYIENTTLVPSKKSQKNSTSLTVHRNKQTFRNRQIYNQKKNEKRGDKKDNKDPKDSKDSDKKDGDNADSADNQTKISTERREVGDGKEDIHEESDDKKVDVQQNDESGTSATAKTNNSPEKSDSVCESAITHVDSNQNEDTTTKNDEPNSEETVANNDTKSGEEKKQHRDDEEISHVSKDRQMDKDDILDNTELPTDNKENLPHVTNAKQKDEHPNQDEKSDIHQILADIEKFPENGATVKEAETNNVDENQMSETTNNDKLDNNIKSKEESKTTHSEPESTQNTLLNTPTASASQSDALDEQVQEVADSVNKEAKACSENLKDKHDICSLITERVTSISVDCDTDEIVEELAVMYEHDWNNSFKALTCCQPSNGLKNSISFLGEILKVSTLKTKQKIERLPKKNLTMADDVNDELTTEKEEFLKKQFQDLQNKFSIVNNDSNGQYTIKTYTAKCVELAWFMCTQDPPLVLDYDSRPMLPEDLYKMFKPYRHSGKFIQSVIWPAIRRSYTGEIVAQGIADFR